MRRRLPWGRTALYRLLGNIAVCTIVAVITVGCSQKKESLETDEAVFVTVNDARLTESGLRELVPSDFYDKLTPDHKKEIVNEWVNNELLYQEALRRKLDQDAAILKIIENTRRTLLINELLERTSAELKTPADDELRKFYESHKQYFVIQDKEYRIRYASFDSRESADDFRRMVKKQAGFSELAKERSKDASAATGGDLGVISQDMVAPEIWQAVENTVRKYGLVKISDPFKVDDGWGCIIIDEAYEPGSAKSFEGVKDRVLDMYMTESRETARTEFLKRLSSDAKITYSNENESGK